MKKKDSIGKRKKHDVQLEHHVMVIPQETGESEGKVAAW